MSPEKYHPQTIKISSIDLSAPMNNFYNFKEETESDTEAEKDAWKLYEESKSASLNTSQSEASKAISSFTIDMKELDIPIVSSNQVSGDLSVSYFVKILSFHQKITILNL